LDQIGKNQKASEVNTMRHHSLYFMRMIDATRHRKICFPISVIMENLTTHCSCPDNLNIGKEVLTLKLIDVTQQVQLCQRLASRHEVNLRVITTGSVQKQV
jgi:MOSC domain-containing protein YiiM